MINNTMQRIKGMLKKMTETLFPPVLESTVRPAAEKYLSNFGIEDIRYPYRNIDCEIILRDSVVYFSWYKWDLECCIRPKEIDLGPQCKVHLVYPETVKDMFGVQLRRGVEALMKQLVEEYEPELLGKFR